MITDDCETLTYIIIYFMYVHIFKVAYCFLVGFVAVFGRMIWLQYKIKLNLDFD